MGSGAEREIGFGLFGEPERERHALVDVLIHKGREAAQRARLSFGGLRESDLSCRVCVSMANSFSTIPLKGAEWWENINMG